MKTKFFPLVAVTILLLLCLTVPRADAQSVPRLSLSGSASGEMTVVIQSSFHQRYGFLYPATYEMKLPGGTAGISVRKKYHASEQWRSLDGKTPADFFNGVEAFRFDTARGFVYVSAAFSSLPDGDSLFIRLSDQADHAVLASQVRLCEYYDNRRAAVTVTADDWADWTRAWYMPLLDIFRSHGLCVTAGVITGSLSRGAWTDIQSQLNQGGVEVAAHSRTHPNIPYSDPVGEVAGCADDIASLVLPPLFRSSGGQYIYVWLAPYGEYDTTVDSLLSTRSYLVARLYPDNGNFAFSDWDETRGHFKPTFPTREIGAPSWGGGMVDSALLKAEFDSVAAEGGIYQLMWHPQVIITDTGKSYFKNHLAYISRRKDIWYANLGHIYANRLLQTTPLNPVSGAPEIAGLPVAAALLQNYPNPFNPNTMIRYSIPARSSVRLSVYDILGREVAVLVNGELEIGNREVRFGGSGLASGVYFARLCVVPSARRDLVAGSGSGPAGASTAVRKLLLVR